MPVVRAGAVSVALASAEALGRWAIQCAISDSRQATAWCVRFPGDGICRLEWQRRCCFCRGRASGAHLGGAKGAQRVVEGPQRARGRTGAERGGLLWTFACLYGLVRTALRQANALVQEPYTSANPAADVRGSPVRQQTTESERGTHEHSSRNERRPSTGR